jgi:hypothetical protein
MQEERQSEGLFAARPLAETFRSGDCWQQWNPAWRVGPKYAEARCLKLARVIVKVVRRVVQRKLLVGLFR